MDTILTRKIKFKRFTKLLVIPTTAGSGAEITPGAVLYKDKIKYNLKDQSLIPDRYFLSSVNYGGEQKVKSFIAI